jgi:hypothetical protein
VRDFSASRGGLLHAAALHATLVAAAREFMIVVEHSAQGPRDSRGRSLRQLDLEHRLLRYRCSYMIYSRQFEQLPASAKSAIYRRLWDVLSGRQRGDTYSRLSRADRAALVEILHDTKSDLPAYFSAAAVH